MAVLGFIKENRVLVAGLVLPFLLIGILTFAKTLPAKLTDPPTYKVAFFTKEWSAKGQINVMIDKGTLMAVFEKNANFQGDTNAVSPVTRIYIYNPKTNTTEETRLTLNKNDKVSIPTPIANMTFANTTLAPDGYEFQSYYSSNHSLVTEIFSYNNNGYAPTLIKKGNIVKIETPKTYNGTTEFLGWITEEAKK